MNPEHTDTFLNRAQLYLREQQPEAVIADCEYVLSKNPAEFRAYFFMAKARQMMQQQQEAIDDLNKAAGIKSDFMELFLLRSSIWMELKEYENALNDTNTAISISSEEKVLTCKELRSMKHLEIQKLLYKIMPLSWN